MVMASILCPDCPWLKTIIQVVMVDVEDMLGVAMVTVEEILTV